MTVNATKLWCLLQQHVATNVSHLQAKHMHKHFKAVYIAFSEQCELNLYIITLPHYVLKPN